MTKLDVEIAVSDYAVDHTGPPIQQEDVDELAAALASDIGIRVADLGDSWHGNVGVRIDGKYGRSA